MERERKSESEWGKRGRGRDQMGQASVQGCAGGGVLCKRSSRMKRKQSVKKVEGRKRERGCARRKLLRCGDGGWDEAFRRTVRWNYCAV